jgi:hypothetical protein
LIPLQVFLATLDLPQPADPNATQVPSALLTRPVLGLLGSVLIHVLKLIVERMRNAESNTTHLYANVFRTISEIPSIDAK